MSQKLRVISYGLGAIGRAAAELVLQKPNMKLVGAVDLNPDAVDRDFRKKIGCPITTGIRGINADAVIHCTGSSFAGIYPQLAQIARAGMHCVTSCEEAMFPAYRNPRLTKDLDRLCAKHEVAMVGTGVNPGFVMDTLVLALTGACRRVDSIRVLRVVDAATRREALQRKVGVGISKAEFMKLAKAEKIRHVGLTESLMFVADGLGWKLNNVNETIGPVLADRRIKTKYFTATPGQVAGVRQIATGKRNGREVLRLELRMYAGAENPRDEIMIAGDAPMKLVLEGGAPGDIATPALLVNSLALLPAARPGLHTMKTLGLPRIAA